MREDRRFLDSKTFSGKITTKVTRRDYLTWSYRLYQTSLNSDGLKKRIGHLRWQQVVFPGKSGERWWKV